MSGEVSHLFLQLLLGFAGAVTLRSKSRRARDHILLSHLRLFSLFVVFYDWQGYGGGILCCLHKGVRNFGRNILVSLIRPGPQRKRRVLNFFFCCTSIFCQGNIFQSPA
jgi:hypothetical protein